MWMIIQIVFVTTFVGTKCQQITLDDPQPLSPCTFGLRNLLDKLAINGTVAGNVADYISSGWEDTIYIQGITKTSGISKICELSLDEQFCIPDRTLDCYCKDVNPTTGDVHFVVNYTAGVVLSQGNIRAKWIFTLDSTTIYSNNQTLPEIHDVNAAELKLNIYGVEGSLSTPGSCNFNVTLNKLNSLRLCCNTTAPLCYPQISFREDVVSGNSCVSYPTSKLPSAGVTGHLVLAISLCNQVDYIQGVNCTVITMPLTTTTTPRTSATSRTTPRTSSENPRPTTPPFLLTSENLWPTTLGFRPTSDFSVESDDDDDGNSLTTIGAGLLIVAVGFVMIFIIMYWVKGGTKKPDSVSAHQEDVTEQEFKSSISEPQICEEQPSTYGQETSV